MKETIETRELIVLDCLGFQVRGTYHKPSCGSSGSLPNRIVRDRLGVVFLNPWYPTRTGKGDSSVYWADRFAERGYPSFRFDPPGCGDSEGDIPAELTNFIDTGGYASIIVSEIKELMTRFDLSGVVLMGLCAGAVCGVYAATASKECKGLVLMDPYFNLAEAPRSEAREKLTARLSQHVLGRLISRAYQRVKSVRLLFLGVQLPGNSNFSLLERWEELVSAGLPILVLQSRATRGKEFDYIRHSLERAGRNSKVIVKTIQGAYHTFSDRLGREAVRQHTNEWLNAFFPVIEKEELAIEAVSFHCFKVESYSQSQENCLKNDIALGK